ncbi:sensor histidine kinase [Kitasatospora sp. NPDC048365]|uniref:sensor histidine kinase n=1 Tax=Kitasatospora sp. NPDC048365 TaxID=3364050 RepID=UPI00371C157E
MPRRLTAATRSEPAARPAHGTLAPPSGDLAEPAPLLARAVVTVVFSGFAALAGLRTLSVQPSAAQLVVFLVSVGTLLALQLLHFTPYAPAPRSRAALGVLALEAVLVFLPFPLFGPTWIGMPGFFAGNLLTLLVGPWAWTGFCVVVAGATALQELYTPQLLDVSYTAVSTTITGLIVYGLIRLAALVVEVKKNRAELTRLAVAQERLRFSQDLHDLLGYSLSAITLKSELTRRLVTSQPSRARDELVEILEISRQALSDVRVVASGYRDMSLADESRSGRSVLAAADIEVSMEIAHDPLPPGVNTVLATVLREGITNVLGHSKAEHCWITVDQRDGAVRLRIVNDGVQPAPQDPPGRHGTGIESLSARVAALGGRLTAGVRADGRFQLEARVPLPGGRGDAVDGTAPAASAA